MRWHASEMLEGSSGKINCLRAWKPHWNDEWYEIFTETDVNVEDEGEFTTDKVENHSEFWAQKMMEYLNVTSIHGTTKSKN